MFKFVNKIDLTAKVHHLYVFGQEKNTTRFGISISILSIICVLFFSIYFFVDFLESKKPLVVYNKNDKVLPQLNHTNLPLMIAMTDSKGVKPDPTIAYFVLTRWEYKPKVPGSFETVSIEPCDINKHFGNYSSYFNGLLYFNSFYCLVPDIKNLTLYG
jgi:hypothetical protein